jgi:hypothetical protein
MVKLTDTHRTLLSAAGARTSLLVLPVPKRLKLSGANLEAQLVQLSKAGLVVEQPAEARLSWASAISTTTRSRNSSERGTPILRS